MDILVAMMTVRREGDYVRQTLASLHGTGFFQHQEWMPLRLSVSGNDSSYLRDLPAPPGSLSIECHDSSIDSLPLETLSVQQRHGTNYLRCLSLLDREPNAEGILILEDDIQLASGWDTRLIQAVQEIRERYGERWVLTLCNFSPVALKHYREGRRWFPMIMSPYDGAGTVGILFPRQIATAFSKCLEMRNVRNYELPTDLLLDKWVKEEGLPYCSTAPSLIQHIGMVSTGCGGGGRRSPSFVEVLPQ